MAIFRVKNLLVRTIIGFNSEERHNKQDVIINLEIQVELPPNVYADQQDDIYDYKLITKQIITLVQESDFNLLENLTKAILDQIMLDKRVQRAKVEVDKPHALRFAESVSVELEESR